MTDSNITLTEPGATHGVRILQLYEHIELYSQGQPPHNSLFVLGRPPLSVLNDAQEQLLIIDPPEDASSRFKLEGAVAVLFTDPAQEIDLPRLTAAREGVAHIQVGQHYLDVYNQPHSTVVHLPALGVICGGDFGSDVTLPRLASGSSGGSELDTLRLLAGLLKRRLQLYIPRIGEPVSDQVRALEQLAEDVAYILGMQRVIPPMAQRGDAFEAARSLGDSLLPSGRRSFLARSVHEENLQTLFQATQAA